MATRKQIQKALEAHGMPDVIAFMAAKNCTNPELITGLVLSRKDSISFMFPFIETPEGSEFWITVIHEMIKDDPKLKTMWCS